jgi:tRNA (cmo5U34)-methyltransferase
MYDHGTDKLTLAGDADRLFARGRYPVPFAFNEEVAQVFDDMVSRSVPLYREVAVAVAEWTNKFYQPGTVIYDIGCSTGTTIDLSARYLAHFGKRARYVGIDTSEPMLQRARAKLAGWADTHTIDLCHQDALTVSYDNASVVVVNYTLQFIPVVQRAELLQKIHAGLRPGGILFLSEKLRSCCPPFHETVTDIYERFKESRGYSRTEIERKKEALDNVLIPLTLEEQTRLLRQAGFAHAEPMIRWHNFTSFVAIKDSSLRSE